MSRKTAAERRADALSAARRLIVEQGIESASVRNVAAAAEMSAGSLRHIFPSHDDLFVALLEDSEATSRARIAAIATSSAAADPRDLVVDMLMQVEPIDADRRSDLLVQLAVLAAHPGNARLAAVRRSIGEALDGLCADVVRGVAEMAGLDQPEVASLELRLVLDGAALRVLEDPDFGEDEVRQLLERALDRLVPRS